MKKIVLLMIIGILISSFHNLNVEIILADLSSNYYVANDGDDLNNGLSPDTPWRTIGKVNIELNGGVINVGDDIYFNRGDTFNDINLSIRLGGTSSDDMIIGAYGTGARPIFDTVAIQAFNGPIGNITVRDLEVKNAVPNSAIAFDAVLSNITVYNCYSHDNGVGIFLRRVNGYKVENCIAHDCGNSGIVIYGSSTNRITNGQIRNCTIYNISTNDGITLHVDDGINGIGPNHLVINCTAYNCSEQAFDFACGYLGENIMIKDCVGYDCNDGGLSAGGVINFTIDNVYLYNGNDEGIILIYNIPGPCENVIVRNCVMDDNSGEQLYIYGNTGKVVNNYTIYNNDIVANATSIYHMQIGNHINHLTFKNNIFTSTADDNPGLFLRGRYGNLTTKNMTFSNNLWWRGDGGAGDDTWWQLNGAVSPETYNLSGWQNLTRTSGETRQDPKLYDPVNGSYNLTSTSPAIDAGTWLTFTEGGGTGTTITVNESNYFCDGYGLIDGDNIFIGDDSNLEVTDVDYGAETITVNRSITWADGEYVSLSSYYGSAPDIGAYEYPSSGPNDNPPEITNIVRVESNPLDTEASFGWINITATVTGYSAIDTVMIDISCSNSSSVNTSMNAMGTNGYYYNTSTLFSNHGSYNYYIWANDTNGNASISSSYDFSMPPNWDIDMNGVCNVLDFILVSNHYNETGSAGWIREDVDNNGIINMLDFVLVSQHYFETW